MKKIAAIFLALTMLLGIALADGSDMWAAYEEPVDVLFVKAVNISGDQVDYTQDNPFITFIKEQFNINIKYKWVTTGDAYQQKVALMLATDDLADVMVVDATTMKQMYEAEQLSPLTQVWDTYADPFTKELMGYGSSISFESGTIDGELYGIPYSVPVHETMHATLLRTDWMDNLNLTQPKSFADLEKILYAFVQQDPDGNGVADTYGIGMNKNLYGDGFELQTIANMMHAYPNAWIKKGDKVVYGSVQPEMKTVLAKLAQWYKDGLIDPEFTVKDCNVEAELVMQGKLGAFTGVQWVSLMMDCIPTLWRDDVNSAWQILGVPELSVDDQPAKPIAYDNTSSFIVVRKGFEHPEAMVKILNMMHKIGAGDSREYFATPQDFTAVWDYFGWMPMSPESIHGNIVKWVNVNAALEEGSDEKVQYNANALNLYNNINDYLNNNDYRHDLENTDARGTAGYMYGLSFCGQNFGLATSYAEQGLLEYDMKGAIVTDAMVDSEATLDKLELETFTRIITGEADISEFDTFVDQWNLLGGEEITESMNEYYGF